MQINGFSELTLLSDNDLIPVWDSANSLTKKTKLSTIKTYAGNGETPGGSSAQFIHLMHSVASGISGGSTTAGGWYKRPINLIQFDQTEEVVLDDDEFTLSEGIYSINVAASFYQTNEVKLRLYNVTADEELLAGVNNYIGNYDAGINCFLSGYFNVDSSQNLAIQYYCNRNIANIGLGTATDFGSNEVYLSASLWKL